MSLLCFGSACRGTCTLLLRKIEIVLIDNKPLTVSLKSPNKDENVWQINVRRTSEKRRTAAENQVHHIEGKEKIVCPKINGLKEQDGWLKEFTLPLNQNNLIASRYQENKETLIVYTNG